MDNPRILISELLREIENRRTQEVIARRFGLVDGIPQTLQQIGDDYKITRERVRQIEKGGLENLTQPKIQDKIKPLEDEIYDYFKEHGELRREEKAFDDLVCYCMPATSRTSLGGPKAQVEQLKQKGATDSALCRAALNLILTLGKSFVYESENEDFHPFWTINKKSVSTAKKTVDSIIKHLNKTHQPQKDSQLFEVIKNNSLGISDEAVASYIDASKVIEQNNFGEYGLIDWPEISPRGVRDKAYLILKKEGKPHHFTQVTNLINQHLPQLKPAYVQTVHNELIKDPRFVLIGRGIYALSEWGYAPGTVIEVIGQILKASGPLTKEEIIKKVMEKRLIKENTILINLQNKKYFKKLEDEQYSYIA